MTTIESIISGFVQGITEFLPISSSGHLVLLHNFFGLAEPELLFDLCLHLGTLLAVVLYFKKDIIRLIVEKNINWFICIAIGTIPAVAVGLLFEDRITVFFADARKIYFMLLVTALVLFIGHLSLKKRKEPRKDIRPVNSLIIGISQACALLPGLSRSGMTISTALVSGVKMEEAYKFSFLLSIPVVLGAVMYKMLTLDAGVISSANYVNYIAGTLTAFIVGFASLHILWRLIKGNKVFIFAIYCFSVGITGILLG